MILMMVEIRIYRRHDADLIMLKSYGINISKMMRLALENYVAGERIKFRLPDSHVCDISSCSMLRYRLNIKNPEVIALLKNIKRGYRNQFCKALLRDMMDTIALGVYLGSDDAVKYEDRRLSKPASVAISDMGLITKRDQLTSFVEERQRPGSADYKKKKLFDQQPSKPIQTEYLQDVPGLSAFTEPQKQTARADAREPEHLSDEQAVSVFDGLAIEPLRATKGIDDSADEKRQKDLFSMFEEMLQSE